jgi:hypothetical protein
VAKSTTIVSRRIGIRTHEADLNDAAHSPDVGPEVRCNRVARCWSRERRETDVSHRLALRESQTRNAQRGGPHDILGLERMRADTCAVAR